MTNAYRIFAARVLVGVMFAAPMIFQPKAVKLFDDKSFNGWEGNLDFFRIEQGSIVAGTMKAPMQRNEFLCTTKQYGDFVLRLRVKLLGDPERANAGIQLRSKRIPNHHEVIGYQADMGQIYWGALYDESRRRRILAGPTPEELSKHLKRDDWNEYEIRAEGNRIRLSLNGHQTADYIETEDGIEQTGVICLQVHAGPPSEAWYREIRIEPLSNKK